MQTMEDGLHTKKSRRKLEHYSNGRGELDCSAQKKDVRYLSFSMPVGWAESAAPCLLDGAINNQTYHAL